CVVAALAACQCGCTKSDTPPLGKVTGVVTLNGKPLPAAMVQFQPDNGRSSYGETNAEGRYELSFSVGNPGAVIGSHTVRVTTSREVVSEAKLDDGKPGGAAPTTKLTAEQLPSSANTKSTLRRDVVAGENQINLELSSKS
ncbi:MAG TPA: hypothetical protein VM510_01790, partial [Caulifigura sp.]|nr:hypothetical protein [Caulifigura sp.]